MKSLLILLLLSSFYITTSLFSANHNENKKPTVPTDMVLIPASEFQMGSQNGDRDEKPVRTVYLDAFYIDTHEVTVGEYKKFINVTGHRALSDSVFRCSPTDQHPVVGCKLARCNRLCQMGRQTFTD